MRTFNTLIAATLCFLTIDVAAQCTGFRYRDFIFPAYDITSDIVYGNNVSESGASQDLKLDVYEPSGDVETSRPLIILAHGGNFLGGSKTGSDVVPLAEDFVSMGYVVASIDYRVGMNNFPVPGPDSVDATESVMRAVHDAKASVRFFKEDYSINGNSYGIDTSLIFFGGVSAGGFMAVHLAYLDELSELPTYIDTTQAGLGGGTEGLSGSQGYSSQVAGIINICGALRDTAWIKTGDTPIISFHGDADQTVPYGTDIISLLGVYPLLVVHGSESIHFKADQVGIENCFWQYPGQDHTPHISNSFYYDSTLVLTRNFLVHLVCGDPMDCTYSNPVSIKDNDRVDIGAIYPNPASDRVFVELNNAIGDLVAIEFLDGYGRLVRNYGINNRNFIIERKELETGMYLLKIETDSGTHYHKVLFN